MTNAQLLSVLEFIELPDAMVLMRCGGELCFAFVRDDGEGHIIESEYCSPKMLADFPFNRLIFCKRVLL